MARYDQCDATCTTDCGHCKGTGGLDLTAAVDAAHRAECPTVGCTATSAAERAVRAALPHLRQQIGEQIAREIEAARTDIALDHGGEVTDTYVRGILFGMDRAARIARGEP